MLKPVKSYQHSLYCSLIYLTRRNPSRLRISFSRVNTKEGMRSDSVFENETENESLLHQEVIMLIKKIPLRLMVASALGATGRPVNG